MKTQLDEYDYQKWYIEGFTYKGGLLILDIARIQIKGDQNISPRFVVAFDDVHYFQAYDELAHTPDEMARREPGIIGLHSDSAMMEHLRSSTNVLENTFGECKHYSVMTGDEFVHIVTRSEPRIIKVA